MLFAKALGLVTAATAVSAITAPIYENFDILWQEDFEGTAGSSPNITTWYLTDSVSVDKNIAAKTSSNANVQISGGGSVQIVPQVDASGVWTSGRMETHDAIRPLVDKITRVEGSLRMSNNPASAKQGISPGFWVLGKSSRFGTSWPLCGQLDILKQRNGELDGFSTVHCSSPATAGICSERGGHGSIVSMPDDTDTAFHTWSITWDRTDSNWHNQKITWALDGNAYFTVTGTQVASEDTWAILAQSPFYLVLEVSVGNDFSGAPNAATAGGYGSMMEVQYLAIYSN